MQTPCSAHIHNGAVHSFRLPVTCLIVGLTHLTCDPSLVAKQVQRAILVSSIRAQHVNPAIKLSLENGHEMLNLLGCNIFRLGQKNGSKWYDGL